MTKTSNWWRQLYNSLPIHRTKIGNLENYNPAECSQLRPLSLATTFYTRALKCIKCFIEIEFLDEFYIITLPLYCTLCIEKISMTILFLLTRVTKNCASFPLFRKKILASKTVTWDTSPLRLRKGTKYIFITIASASSIKKISLSNSDTTLLLEKNYTAKQNPSNTFLPSKSRKNVILVFYPLPPPPRNFTFLAFNSHAFRFDHREKPSSEIPPCRWSKNRMRRNARPRGGK